MMRKISLKQNGITLIELLVGMTIAALLLTAVVFVSKNSIVMNTNVNNQANATNQLKNAFNYISRDVERAGTVAPTPTNTNNFPLTLTWTESPTTQSTVTYRIVDKALQRDYTGPDGTSTMKVAYYVNPDSSKTNCSWDKVNDNLTVNMTITLGSISAARQFIITPRVVQSSSLEANTTSLTATATTTTYGQLVTFTATVTPVSGSDIVKSGTVTFLDNGISVYVSPVVNGVATYPISNLPINIHPLIAVYSGDAVYASSISGECDVNVIGAPTATAISPNSGPMTGGTSVTITGTNFVSGVTVTIGGHAATGVTLVDSNTITANTPAGSFGPVDVVVNLYGGSGTLTQGYTYTGPPTVTAISPNSGPIAGGSSVTIIGTNFVNGATVTIGINTMPGTVTNATTLTVSTPASLITGSVNVVVTTTYGSGTLFNGYTYVAAPTVATITPNTGSTLGGTSVTISGTNFITGATTVTIGGASVTNISVTNAVTLTAKTPAGTVGARDVVVTTIGGSATLAGGYTYTGPIYISTASGGNWATSSTWVGNTVPGVGDSVVIATTGSNKVEIAANLTQTAAGSVTINSGATLSVNTSGVAVTLGALTINSGGTITVNRDFTVLGATSIDGRINFGSTSSTNRTMMFNGNVTLNNGAVWNETTTGAVADFSFGNSLTNNASTFTAQNNSNAVHIFTGSGKIISGATVTAIPYLTINGTITNNGTLTVASMLAGSGTLTNGATGTLNINFTGAVGISALNALTTGNTVNYGYAGTQTVKATAYYNLILSGSILSGSGAKSIGNGTSVSGRLTIAPVVGATASIGSGLNISVNTLTLGVTNEPSGTWGYSGRVHNSTTYFANTTGYLTVAN